MANSPGELGVAIQNEIRRPFEADRFFLLVERTKDDVHPDSVHCQHEKENSAMYVRTYPGRVSSGSAEISASPRAVKAVYTQNYGTKGCYNCSDTLHIWQYTETFAATFHAINFWSLCILLDLRSSSRR